MLPFPQGLPNLFPAERFVIAKGGGGGGLPHLGAREGRAALKYGCVPGGCSCLLGTGWLRLCDSVKAGLNRAGGTGLPQPPHQAGSQLLPKGPCPPAASLRCWGSGWRGGPLPAVELVPIPRLAGLYQTCPVLPGQAPARGGAASSASAPPGLLRPHAELQEPGSAPKLPPEKEGKHPRGDSLPLTQQARRGVGGKWLMLP